MVEHGDKIASGAKKNFWLPPCFKVHLCGPLYLNGPIYLHGALSLLCGPFTHMEGLTLPYGALSPPWASPGLGARWWSALALKVGRIGKTQLYQLNRRSVHGEGQWCNWRRSWVDTHAIDLQQLEHPAGYRVQTTYNINNTNIVSLLVAYSRISLDKHPYDREWVVSSQPLMRLPSTLFCPAALWFGPGRATASHGLGRVGPPEGLEWAGRADIFSPVNISNCRRRKSVRRYRINNSCA